MSKAKTRTTPKPPRRHLTLSAAQAAAVEELAVLNACTDGFCYTPAMDRAFAAIARKVDPATRLAILTNAAQRERIAA